MASQRRGPRRRKYRAIPTEVDGIRFDSKAEAHRYRELRLLARQDLIRNLKIHTRYPLKIGGQKVCIFVDDFSYDVPEGRRVVEDVKGFKTRVYRLKKKLMKTIYGIDILETRPRCGKNCLLCSINGLTGLATAGSG